MMLAWVAVQLFLAALPVSTPAEGDVAVAARAVPPFAMRADDGAWEGLAIDLWEGIAARLDLTTTYSETGLGEMLDGVGAGTYDAAAAALTVTAERERRMDFSHPFLTSGLGIAVQARGGSRGWAMLTQIISPAFFQAVLALGGVLLAFGVLVWLFERRANAEQFGGGVRGVGSGFWWSAVTMTTVGYGDKAPVTFGGRIIGLLWMFASIIVISGFTASIASSLTVDRLETAIQGPDDLPGTRVGTVGDSTGEAWTERRFLHAAPYASAGEALEALAADELDAVVYDAPILRYLANTRFGGAVTVLPGHVARQDYAFALPEGSALREDVNQGILEITASPEWQETLARYLGE